MPATDPELHIDIDHSAYYRWMPTPEADLTWVTDDVGEVTVFLTADLGPEDTTVPRPPAEPQMVVDSTFPGFKLRRVTVEEPATSQTTVHLPSLSRINEDRKAAGVSRRSNAANLTRLLEDAGWSKQFPVESITAIRCDDKKWAKWLNDHFLAAGDEDEYEVAASTAENEDGPAVDEEKA